MWTLDSTAPVPHWRPHQPERTATIAFSTRRGGVSAPPFDTLNLGKSTADAPESVAENRRRLLAGLGAVPEALATAGQVHGARVVRVEAPGHTPECDGLVTRVAGLVLAVTTADCMALLYVARGAVAAAHCGWRGAADGMPLAALDATVAAGACAPGDVHVHIGPCIRSCCYEIGDDVAARFPPGAVVEAGGRRTLDLPGVARAALVAAGVPGHQVHDTGSCTACEPHWYFSHRRDRGRTGRQWGVVVRHGLVEVL